MRSLLVLLLAAGLLPSPCDAQVRVIPTVGVYASPSELGVIKDDDWAHTPFLVGTREPTIAYGLTLALATESRIDLRFSGLVGYRSGIRHQTTVATVQTVSAGINLNLLGKSPDFHPYLLVGGGFKRYDFLLPDGLQVDYAFSEDLLLSGVLGIGVGKKLGPLTVTLELSDHIGQSPLRSNIRNDLQHDLFFTLGLLPRYLSFGT